MLAPWIVDAANLLGRAFSAQSVRVFGSYARGDESKRSDLDLFVVSETDLSPLDRIGKALELLSDVRCAVDVVIYTPDELARFEHRPFIRRILQEGQVVYEQGQAPR